MPDIAVSDLLPIEERLRSTRLWRPWLGILQIALNTSPPHWGSPFREGALELSLFYQPYFAWLKKIGFSGAGDHARLRRKLSGRDERVSSRASSCGWTVVN